MKQLTEKEAIEFAESKAYLAMDDREIAEFQLAQDKLCMPFDVFHRAIEKALGRPVYTHEFGSAGISGLRAELLGEKEPATLGEIMDLIPEHKRIIIVKKWGGKDE